MSSGQKKSAEVALGCILLLFGFSCATKDISHHLLSLAEKKQAPIEEAPNSPTKEESEGFICPKKEEAEGCWMLPQCKEFCNELFFTSRTDRQNCYNWPLSLFSDFKDLFEIIQTDRFQSMDTKALKCFLEWSDGSKDIFLRQLNKAEAQELLIRVAHDIELASSFYKADRSDLSILHGIYKKIGGRTPTAVKKGLKPGGDNFLILLDKYNNPAAWYWLNSHIVYRCKRDHSCQEPLEYYCEILEDTGTSVLNDFFENRFFSLKYRGSIKSKTCGSSSCEYGNVEDFHQMCRSI